MQSDWHEQNLKMHIMVFTGHLKNSGDAKLTSHIIKKVFLEKYLEGKNQKNVLGKNITINFHNRNQKNVFHFLTEGLQITKLKGYTGTKRTRRAYYTAQNKRFL